MDLEFTVQRGYLLCFWPRGIYPPWSGGSHPPAPPTGIMAWYTCIIPITSRCVRARRNDQNSEIIIEGASTQESKEARWKVELLEIHHYSHWLQTMQWLKWFVNTGEALLKICHPVPKLHITHLFLSSLSLPLISLLWQLYMVWGLEDAVLQASPAGIRAAPQRLRRSCQRFLCILDWNCWTSCMVSNEENYVTHPMSLLIILVAACECVIASFVWH